MNMQDKEFDDLFRSKLDEVEVEPSAQVWAGIENGLGVKKRRSMIPMLGIAASLVVLIIAAILFIPKGETVKPDKKPVKNALATNHARSKPVAPKPANATTDMVKKTDIQPENIAVNTAHKVLIKHRNTEETVPEPTDRSGSIIQKQEPVKVDDQPVLAASPVTETPVVNKAVVPDVSTPLATKQDVNEGQATAVKPVLAAVPSASTQAVKTTPKRHGIHSFGDLVNIVVAKVDKRKDKLIEFTDNDDDGSVISAVNAGIVKIKRDK